MSQFEDHEVKIVNSPLLHVCSFQAFNKLDDAHPHWGEGEQFTQSTDSNVILTQKHLTDVPRIMLNRKDGYGIAQVTHETNTMARLK